MTTEKPTAAPELETLNAAIQLRRRLRSLLWDTQRRRRNTVRYDLVHRFDGRARAMETSIRLLTDLVIRDGSPCAAAD